MKEGLVMPISEVYNIDCNEYMKTIPDKFFELAVCDPPYGIGASDYKRGGTQYGNSKTKCKVYDSKNWDKNIPDKSYFDELFRISKNQIIWGGNYFNLPTSSCWIIWDKMNREGSGYADCELAWTSFDTAVRRFYFRWAGMLQGNMKHKQERIHPTEKPYELYQWCFNKYAKPGNKIFDSHLGSQSSRIAAYKLGFDFWGCELDPDYFKDGCERFERECNGIITTKQGVKIIQQKLF